MHIFVCFSFYKLWNSFFKSFFHLKSLLDLFSAWILRSEACLNSFLGKSAVTVKKNSVTIWCTAIRCGQAVTQNKTVRPKYFQSRICISVILRLFIWCFLCRRTFLLHIKRDDNEIVFQNKLSANLKEAGLFWISDWSKFCFKTQVHTSSRLQSCLRD